MAGKQAGGDEGSGTRSSLMYETIRIVDKLKPKYFGNICGTTGLFVFLIKDCLEYCGAVEDKKTQGSRIKANYLYQKTLFDKLNKNISYLEGLVPKKTD